MFFDHSRNITKKFGPLYSIFWALGAGSRLKIDGSETLDLMHALVERIKAIII